MQEPTGVSPAAMAGGAGSPLDRRVGRSIFGQDAAGYDRSRSDYPAGLYEAVGRRAARRPRIAEIGTGTGLATAGLLSLEPRRLALVEADAGMAAFLASRFAATGAEVIRAPFPDAPLEGPFDLMACAAAFHWLEAGPALERIMELLVPGGVWAVWWNGYFGHGLNDPFGDRVGALLLEQDVALPTSYVGRRHYAFDADFHRAQLRDAGFEGVQHFAFESRRMFSADDARALYATFSFIQVLAPPDRTRILDGIGRIVEEEFAGNAAGVCATSLFLSSKPG